MSVLEKIGITNLLNIILVKENVRPAMLIQPVNYNEYRGTDKKMTIILNAIKLHFPELYQSENYTNYQGTIISKINFNGQHISNERMGKILGYPSYKDFQNMDKNKDNYTIIIEVFYKNINSSVEYSIEIFANYCKDLSKLIKYKILSSRFEKILKNNKYKELLGENIITKVDYDIIKNVSTQSLIDKLIHKKELDNDDKYKIQNILYNFGFSTEIQFYFQIYFDYNNDIHKGILLSILLNEKYYLLEPFTPLKRFQKQDKDIRIIIQNWEYSIINILKQTQISI